MSATRTLSLAPTWREYVRPMMGRGQEPFSKIMEPIVTLTLTEDLVLITSFLPSPLIEKLQSEGFHARPERRDDGGWQTLFARK